MCLQPQPCSVPTPSASKRVNTAICAQSTRQARQRGNRPLENACSFRIQQSEYAHLCSEARIPTAPPQLLFSAYIQSLLWSTIEQQRRFPVRFWRYCIFRPFLCADAFPGRPGISLLPADAPRDGGAPCLQKYAT